MSPTLIAKLIRTACEQVAAGRPQSDGVTFTPHDFRRLFATDLVNNGLPIHIGDAFLGHASLQTTRGYVAVFDEDVVRHYQLHLARRRQLRPDDQYHKETEAEWDEFEDHFDKRKVELGSCGRPYGTPCAHEHACVRRPMLHVEPQLLPRLDEIEADLTSRWDRAESEGWRGEIEDIEVTLDHLRSKRVRAQRIRPKRTGHAADTCGPQPVQRLTSYDAGRYVACPCVSTGTVPVGRRDQLLPAPRPHRSGVHTASQP